MYIVLPGVGIGPKQQQGKGCVSNKAGPFFSCPGRRGKGSSVWTKSLRQTKVQCGYSWCVIGLAEGLCVGVAHVRYMWVCRILHHIAYLHLTPPNYFSCMYEWQAMPDYMLIALSIGVLSVSPLGIDMETASRLVSVSQSSTGNRAHIATPLWQGFMCKRGGPPLSLRQIFHPEYTF